MSSKPQASRLTRMDWITIVSAVGTLIGLLFPGFRAWLKDAARFVYTDHAQVSLLVVLAGGAVLALVLRLRSIHVGDLRKEKANADKEQIGALMQVLPPNGPTLSQERDGRYLVPPDWSETGRRAEVVARLEGEGLEVVRIYEELIKRSRELHG